MAAAPYGIEQEFNGWLMGHSLGILNGKT